MKHEDLSTELIRYIGHHKKKLGWIYLNNSVDKFKFCVSTTRTE